VSNNLLSGRWIIASVFIVASCSQGDAPRLAGPTAPAATLAGAGAATGTVGSLAAGDVRVGTGPLEIDAVQLGRETSSGASILKQYANPGGEYRMEVGETIQIWVEYDRGDGDYPSGVSGNPRLIIDWGEGEIDRFDFTNCGACKLKHVYPRAGRYAVKVTLDNRAGTTVTRSFFLSSVDLATCVPPSSSTVPDLIVCGAGTYNVSPYFSGSGLNYSVTTVPCVLSSGDVSASIAVACVMGFNDPTVGILSFNASCFLTCRQVTATNACGTTSQRFRLGCT
jgi:hypothetical protein